MRAFWFTLIIVLPCLSILSALAFARILRGLFSGKQELGPFLMGVVWMMRHPIPPRDSDGPNGTSKLFTRISTNVVLWSLGISAVVAGIARLQAE
jgi:hypothetical protein